jgi:[ribosomal protein S18]-alanine N-acetyltransferase
MKPHLNLFQLQPILNPKLKADPSDWVIETYHSSLLPSIMKIERSSFITPWTRNEIKSAVAPLESSCYLAKSRKDLTFAGYIIADDCDIKKTEIVSLAVLPEYRVQGVGEMLVDIVCGESKKERVEVAVKESNLGAQKFFRSVGFEAYRVIRSDYPDREDKYLFRC